MRSLLETIKILSFACVIIASIGGLKAQDFPEPMNPPRLVNDFIGLLSEQEFQYLEHKLEMYHDTTSNQFAIIIIPTTNGYDMAQYTAELGEKWGVGQKGKDNGLLIAISFDERKMHISTGYGLEATIPDATAKRIVENYLKPNFRKEAYFQGLDEATSILIGLAEGEFVAEEIDAQASDPIKEILGFIMMASFFVIPFYLINKRSAGRHYGTSSPSFWMIMALMMSGRRSGGHSGGSFSDFSGGGGGFGGFGGGGFGGGGAGGSW